MHAYTWYGPGDSYSRTFPLKPLSQHTVALVYSFIHFILLLLLIPLTCHNPNRISFCQVNRNLSLLPLSSSCPHHRPHPDSILEAELFKEFVFLVGTGMACVMTPWYFRPQTHPMMQLGRCKMRENDSLSFFFCFDFFERAWITVDWTVSSTDV